jgi:hypothetical protein
LELEGVVHKAIIVPDDGTGLPEGTRVRIIVVPAEQPKPFGERFARFKWAVPGLPADSASQQDHDRAGATEAMTVLAKSTCLSQPSESRRPVFTVMNVGQPPRLSGRITCRLVTTECSRRWLSRVMNVGQPPRLS